MSTSFAGRVARSAAVLFVVIAFTRCADPDLPTAVMPADASLAKGGAGGGGGGGGAKGPTVTATDPAYGYPGDVDDQITITGSGLAGDVEVAWERGAVAATKITVHSAAVVNSTTIRARISIAEDADLDLYDVSVTLLGPDRKKGIGTELFEVTTAENLGVSGTNTGTMPGWSVLSEPGTVVGAPGVYDAASGGLVKFEKGGQGWGVDPWGQVAFGQGSFARAWVRQSNGTYKGQDLPKLSDTRGGRAHSGARTVAGTLLVGGWDQSSAGVNRPAVWSRTGSTWSGPQLYVNPFDGQGTAIRSINANGQAAGIAPGRGIGVVWDNSTTFVLLDGLANGINPAGTVVVGELSGRPAFWYRDAATGQWSTTGVVLPSIAPTSCSARLSANVINGAGIIVGASCNSDGTAQATAWRLDLSTSQPTVASVQALPGLGARQRRCGRGEFRCARSDRLCALHSCWHSDREGRELVLGQVGSGLSVM